MSFVGCWRRLGAAAEQPVSEVALGLSAPDTPIPLDGLAVHLEYARCASSQSTCIKLCAPALPRPRIHYTPIHTQREGGYGDRGDSASTWVLARPTSRTDRPRNTATSLAHRLDEWVAFSPSG